jgi:hypothetical protein
MKPSITWVERGVDDGDDLCEDKEQLCIPTWVLLETRTINMTRT